MDEELAIHSAVLELAEEALIVRDMEDGVSFWSAGAERMYGWKSHEAVGRNLQDLLDERLLSDDCTERSIESGEWTGELLHRTKDGKVVLVRSRMKLLRDALDSPTSVLIANTDITAQKAMEADLIRLQRMETVNRLGSLVMHNLNNELAILSLHLIEPAERSHEALRQSVEYATLMAQLLSVAKGSDSEHVAIPVGKLIKEVTDILEHAFPKCIVIENTVSETIGYVTGNPTHLRQVLMNLCVNARDAMQSGGVLTIDAENIAGAPNRIVIHVSDTGSGIPIDLFVTASIVKNHGGSIETSRRIGQGTHLRIYLPAAESGIGHPDKRVAHVKTA
jgi:PAS domain S-box-containing protein